MTNSFNISPFIKTAFVALAFFAGSVPSASHADDFLATFSTQGLSELSLDTNPKDLQKLELLELGVCPQDPDPDLVELIKRSKARIAQLETQKITAAAENNIKKAKIEKEIAKLQKELALAIDMQDPVRAAIARGLILGKKADLEALDQQLVDLQTEINREKLLIDWFERCKTDPKAKL